MYPTILFLHSWFRWVVLLVGVIAVTRAFASSGRRWSVTDQRVARAFGICLDLQFLLGVTLYVWLSPITTAALHDFGLAMRVSQMRFWVIEHPAGMLAAMVLVHIATARIGKAADAAKARRIARIFYSLALVLTVGSIPWPGLPYGRTLIRSF